MVKRHTPTHLLGATSPWGETAMQQNATSESFTSDVVTGVTAIENERREVSRRVGILLAAADEKTVSRLNARLLVFARRPVVELTPWRFG